MKKNNKDREPAILNMELKDLPSEEWRSVPWFDGIVEVSNYGRVKRLAHQVVDTRGRLFSKKDKILKTKLKVTFNHFLKTRHYHPTTRISINAKNHFISIARIVYYLFVEEYDISDRSTLIIAKDHDGLNMGPENLIKVSYEQFQEHIRNSGRRAPDFWKTNRMGKPFFNIGQESHKRQISKYDFDGKWIATYDSIGEASKQSGVNPSAIGSAANGKVLTSGGYVWRFGNEQDVNVDFGDKVPRSHKLKKKIG